MTTYKADELKDDLLNRAVAKALNFRYEKESCAINDDLELIDDETGMKIKYFNPVENWGQCGELIEKFDISVKTRRFGQFKKDYQCDIYSQHFSVADERKIAICRCVVQAVFGDEVEL